MCVMTCAAESRQRAPYAARFSRMCPAEAERGLVTSPSCHDQATSTCTMGRPRGREVSEVSDKSDWVFKNASCPIACLWEHSYGRPKLAQHLDILGIFLTQVSPVSALRHGRGFDGASGAVSTDLPGCAACFGRHPRHGGVARQEHRHAFLGPTKTAGSLAHSCHTSLAVRKFLVGEESAG